MPYTLESQLVSPAADQLCQAFAGLTNPEDIQAFLRDLLTLEEYTEAVRRFAAAKRLAQGQTIRAVAREVESSVTTVVRVNHWLHHGTGGYRRALGVVTT